MVRQVVVKVVGDLAHLRQLIPCNVGEIVVLVVVTHVEREAVEPPVVRVRLLVPEEHIVLGDEMRRERVDLAGEKRLQQEVPDRAHAKGLYDGDVKGDLNGKVQDEPGVDGLLAHDARADGVEQDLVEGKEDFGRHAAVVEQPRLGRVRDVRVKPITALAQRSEKGVRSPKICKLANALLWKYSCRRLKLAQLLGELGVFLARQPLLAE